MQRFLLLLLLSASGSLQSQTLGGNSVFNFLKQPNTAQLSALGGVNTSVIGNNVGMAFHSPTLLRKEMHGQVDVSFNAFLAGINNYSLTTAWHLESAKTNVGMGINYFDYGIITQTDAAGNIAGVFRPRDQVIQVMASRSYKEKWWYGGTLKYIHSNYGLYRSAGLALDGGVTYYDPEQQLQISVLVKNIGTQLRTYDGSDQKEELPFDLQFGITRRFKKAPVQLSLTAHQLHRFNSFYNDTTFRANEGDNNYAGSTTAQQILGHFVLSAQFFLHEKLDITTGYHFLRRQDLNAFNVSNGLNGLNLGIGLLLKKLHIRYATGFYQSNLYHQLSMNLNWKGAVL